jgi:putative O-methyltransferase
MSVDNQRLPYDKVVQAVLGRAKRTKSDQVSRSELAIILGELARVLGRQVAGAAVELGCYRGATSLMMAQLMVELAPTKQLYLYDSFAGLPSKTEYDRSALGDDFQPGVLKASKSEVLKAFAHANLPRPTVKKAWFSQLSGDDLPERICFAYFDGDYYDSIRDSFRVCRGRLAPGATLVVDDYDNASLPGVRRAVDEWREAGLSSVESFRPVDSLAVIRLMV